MNDLYRNLPKTVKVGCYVFAIEVMHSADSEANREYGHMNPISQKIRLSPGMTAQRLANTFIHEVLHAIHMTVGLNDESTEEQFTTLSANGLCLFMQDNPEACKWWVKTNLMGRAE